MAYFPLFIELEKKKVLVVGAGAVGARRIEVLVRFGADVTVVAKEADSRVELLESEGAIRLLRGEYKTFREALFSGTGSPFFLILTATGEADTDAMAAEDARARGIFYNCAGDKSRSDFYFPGIAREGVITAGVIAGGEDHRLAKDAAEGVREFLRESPLCGRARKRDDAAAGKGGASDQVRKGTEEKDEWKNHSNRKSGEPSGRDTIGDRG